jgi:hypothetical protein
VAAPGDEDAVRCKVVAHIKSDTTDKELTAIRAAERLPINQSYYKVTHVDPSTIGSVLDLSMLACCCDCVDPLLCSLNLHAYLVCHAPSVNQMDEKIYASLCSATILLSLLV